jgi:hypothetical protein
VSKVGIIDDPVWTELPPSTVPRASADRAKRHRWLWAAVPIATVAVGGWWLFCGHQNPGSGDPGGKIMEQLTPAATAIPGYGTAAVPWVRQLSPDTYNSSIIKIEPHQDSCDGMTGTQGWSQVVVQSRFQWGQDLPALLAYMEPRLAKLGWSAAPEALPSSPPNQNWTKTLTTGTRADLIVTQEGGTTSSVWQLVAQGDPIGKAASC